MRSRKEIEALLAKFVPRVMDPEQGTPALRESMGLLYDAVIVELLLDMRDLQTTMNRRLSRLGSTPTE